VPEAIIQPVVSDTAGAHDGPFRLNLSPACKPLPKLKTKTKTKAKSKEHASRKTVRRSTKRLG
jgi:hypothetical protein